jgi:formylglycine-generating enzyme required for sulfatase activity
MAFGLLTRSTLAARPTLRDGPFWLLLFCLLIPSLDAESAEQTTVVEQPLPVSDPPLRSFRDCDDCPEMVLIPGGSFLMGSPPDERGRYESEGPLHDVSLPSYAIGRFEVTRREFARFVSDTGHSTGPCVYWEIGFRPTPTGNDLELHNPSHRHRPTGRHPVNCVSWHDAKAYVDWLRDKTGKAYRLPSEAEWEYAARAGTQARFPWGDDENLACAHANGHDETSRGTNAFNWPSLICDDGQGQTAPVGTYRANGFSLFDMSGNLWEWVEDHYHHTYDGAPADGRAWQSPGQSTHVLRGGSWENEPRALRSASRIWSRPESRLNSNGFRVALSLP